MIRHKAQTNKIIKIVQKYLRVKYGKVYKEWTLMLELLADNIDLYTQCKEELLNTPLYEPSTFRKNPLLATIKDLQASIFKQVQHLGISPYADAKIKLVEDGDKEEDFLRALTSNIEQEDKDE